MSTMLKSRTAERKSATVARAAPTAVSAVVSCRSTISLLRTKWSSAMRMVSIPTSRRVSPAMPA